MSLFGETVKQLRLLREMSQDELAAACGYTDRSSIAKIEAGKIDVPQKKIMALAKALNVKPSDLLNTSSLAAQVDYLVNLSDDEKILIEHYRKADINSKILAALAVKDNDLGSKLIEEKKAQDIS